MKSTKLVSLVVIAAVAITVTGFQAGFAEAKKKFEPAKIGIVSVRTVLDESKSNEQWEQKINQQSKEVTEELKRLQAEAESLKQQTLALKPGTEDYAEKKRQFAEKQAILKAKDNYYQEEFGNMQKEWAEEFYQEILEAVQQAAENNNLDIVLAREDVDLPAPSARELMLTIKTTKVLYNSDHLDITDQVLAIVDAGK
ncbi:Outer membrane protein [Anaerohalosphaera lusitana]|uniref:Outer membrane protein n=1 Tax=Anaerohalosphaera lusitana TaxID=1936003 RepID=A0A1U9NHY7_9BACT|nr:OmpH family outer membrane protein [Anaerohalosphaera lusitana]AQT67334.1 Outer membrane protein [Anaerohalosphaera lusitana]